MMGMVGAVGIAGGAGSHASAFLARTSGLDGTHTTAYTNLINGLDTDGIFSKLDLLHIYATQDSTTALLNLVSTSFGGTANGSPTFTVDRGFTGVDGSTTVYIDSGFDASTAPTPQFVQNSAHVSAWCVTDIGAFARAVIGNVGGNETDIYPKHSDNNTYYRVNASGISGVANTTSNGHYCANRSSSSAVQGYKNGSSVLTNNAATSGAVVGGNFQILKALNLGGSAHQLAMASIGASLSSTDVTNFYNRLRTYMTAVGVP